MFANNNGREYLRDNFDQDYRCNGNARMPHRNVFQSTDDWGERDFVNGRSQPPMAQRNVFPNNCERAYYRDNFEQDYIYNGNARLPHRSVFQPMDGLSERDFHPFSGSSFQGPMLNFKDFEDTIEHFTGEKNQNLHEWLNEFEKIARMLGWSDLHRWLYSRRLMRGTAKNFIDSNVGSR